MKKISDILLNYHHNQKDCLIDLYPNYSNTELVDYHNLKFDIIVPLDGPIDINYYMNCYQVQPGDIVISCPHNVAVLAPNHPKTLIIQIPLSILYAKPLESFISALAPLKLVEHDSTSILYARLISYIIDIIEEYYSSSTKKDLTIYIKLMQIIESLTNEPVEDRLLSSYNVTEAKQKEYAEKFMQICEYINQHYSSVISLEEVADLAGFSKYHFSRLFKQFTGETFYQYLNHKRMTAAQILLHNPQLSITDVALLSGFPNISSFIRMFKLHNKCTPSEFRIEALKNA